MSLSPVQKVSILTLATLGLIPIPHVEAQEPAGGGNPGVFFESVDVDVVNVEVFVTDKKGNAVTGLTREDFSLRVDGTEVPVSNFYSEVLGRPVQEGQDLALLDQQDSFEATPLEQRLHLVVFVDNANIRAPNRKRVFKALREFLDNSLSPDDRVTVASISKSVFTHSDFLNDRRVINLALDDVEKASANDFIHEFERREIYSELFREETTAVLRGEVDRQIARSTEDINRGGILNRIRAYAQSEFDRSRSGLRHLGAYVDSLAGVPGRKALIHVSDSIPNNPGEGMFIAWNERFRGTLAAEDYQIQVGQFDLRDQFRELGQRANAARVTMYTLDAESSHTSAIRSAVTDGVIPNLSLSTIESNYREPLEFVATATGGRRVQANPTLARQLSAISTDFNTFYSLGFQAVEKGSKNHHDIEVKLARKGLVVRHRNNYTRKNREQRMASATVAALLYNSVSNPLEVSLTKGLGKKRDDGSVAVPVELKIPVSKLVLLPTEGIHAAQLSLFVTIKDKQGDPRPVQRIPFNLRIPDEFVEQAKADSAQYTLPVVLRPGDQQIAIGVRDDIGATSSTLRIELNPRLAGAV
ncbi:MAG: VWA domain-containing protein [Deltaproteobacteria bacterium]|nr:VWA domain-containing protein [Deltaproteobacteria bacterium]